MNLKSLKLFLFFCLTIALCSEDNIIELGVSNIEKLGNNEYLIDIYAKNNVPIAGIQFDILGEPFTDQKNGKWDSNEPFIDVNSNSSWDEGEPFTDKLNNQWDFGEPYKDINKNKKYDHELFTILEVSGGRAESNGLDFHLGKNKGVVLAFSMKGDLISEFAPNNNSLFSIKVRKNNNIPCEFNIHSIIAGQKGVKVASRFIPKLIK